MRRTEFGCRWVALKARLLRQQGCTYREIGALLKCTPISALRYAKWDGQGQVFAGTNKHMKARKE